MPQWDGIEDSSSVPSQVWLSRRKRLPESTGTTSTATKPLSSEERIWQPLRKCDCTALNQAPPETTVFVEGGRASADPINHLVFFNFFMGYQRELTSAIWFVREEKSSNEIILHPISGKDDSKKIEALYQQAVSATSSLGKGIASVLEEEVQLSDDSKVKVMKVGGLLSMRKVPPGWFSSSQILQRGYGEYTVQGEEEEQTLGPVQHLVFVVHGIGEAMFAREDVSLPDLIDMTNTTRVAVQKRQVAEWKKQCEKAKAQGHPPPPPPNRIEFLPIQWYNRLHDSSSELMKTLQAVTLTSIPALRGIANDIIFDVLLYMTPSFCQAVIETVTDQINDLYRTFNKIHPHFAKRGGEISLIGHSLGSVIVWDILAILKENSTKQNERSESSSSFTLDDQKVGYHAYAQKEHADEAQHGTWGPSLVKPIKEIIPFQPKHTIFLGSPLGMFLTLRGAHPVFDATRPQSSEDVPRPLTSPFTLPTGSLYNIFNASDPVAYRIEPLLLPKDTPLGEIPPPQYLTAPGKDVRLHIKARQIGDEIRKSIMDPKAINSLFETAISAISTQTSDNTQQDKEAAHQPLCFALGGGSTRVDYSFQPSVIDNEYISAVLAHSGSTYFLNEDLLAFMINKFAPLDVSAVASAKQSPTVPTVSAALSSA